MIKTLYITKAAIRYPSGEVVTSNRHYKIIALQAKLGISSVGISADEQGFVDNEGNFLTRTEAKEVAIRSGQIAADHKGMLYSEDLWPNNMLTEV